MKEWTREIPVVPTKGPSTFTWYWEISAKEPIIFEISPNRSISYKKGFWAVNSIVMPTNNPNEKDNMSEWTREIPVVPTKGPSEYILFWYDEDKTPLIMHLWENRYLKQKKGKGWWGLANIKRPVTNPFTGELIDIGKKVEDIEEKVEEVVFVEEAPAPARVGPPQIEFKRKPPQIKFKGNGLIPY